MNVLQNLIGRVSLVCNDEILRLKDKVSHNLRIAFGESDDVVLFRNILNKSFFDSMDINDLLLCYSDHIMSDYELLGFVSVNDFVYYDMDEIPITYDVRYLIIKYLLSVNDISILEGLLKLFRAPLIGGSNSYTLFDCYKSFVSIIALKDDELKVIKLLEFMSLVDIKYFIDDLDRVDISFDIVKDYINSNKINIDGVDRLLSNYRLLKNKSLSNDESRTKVLVDYDRYAKDNKIFNIDEFVTYYNSKYQDNFSDFYYSDEFRLLDSQLLIFFIKTRDNCNCDSFFEYRDYLSCLDILSNLSINWNRLVEEFINDRVLYNRDINVILDNHSIDLERLKEDIPVTLRYYIFLNIPNELRESFTRLVMWYKDKDFLNSQIYIDTDAKRDRTKDMIIVDDKEDIFRDFSSRKEIHKYYLDLLRSVTSLRVITNSNWNSLLPNIVNEYYARLGLEHINNMLKLLMDGKSLLEYQDNNFTANEFKLMCDAVKLLYPELSTNVDLVSDKYNFEYKESLIERRKLIDQLIADKYVNIIRDFVTGNYFSKSHYFTVSSVSSTRFEKAVSYVRENEPELYSEYCNKTVFSINRKR